MSAAALASPRAPAGMRAFAVACMLVALAACASNGEKPKPVALSPDTGSVHVRQAWAAHLPATAFALRIAVNDATVTVAASDGTVAAI
ncbi:MAG: outer membrane protein assembly factor BamB, partial [Pseudomonadota bacterium]